MLGWHATLRSLCKLCCAGACSEPLLPGPPSLPLWKAAPCATPACRAAGSATPLVIAWAAAPRPMSPYSPHRLSCSHTGNLTTHHTPHCPTLIERQHRETGPVLALCPWRTPVSAPLSALPSFSASHRTSSPHPHHPLAVPRLPPPAAFGAAALAFGCHRLLLVRACGTCPHLTHSVLTAPLTPFTTPTALLACTSLVFRPSRGGGGATRLLLGACTGSLPTSTPPCSVPPFAPAVPPPLGHRASHVCRYFPIPCPPRPYPFLGLLQGNAP